LDVPNSYSLPTLTELMYDYCKKSDNSEISSRQDNFDNTFQNSFGWVLKRTLRVPGISTADIIITSENRNDTDPQTVLAILMQLDRGTIIKPKISELKRLESELTTKLESFVIHLRRLSEYIDLEIPYKD